MGMTWKRRQLNGADGAVRALVLQNQATQSSDMIRQREFVDDQP